MTSEAFEEIHQVGFGDISNNMASLIQYGKYGTTNTTDTTTMGLYVIEFLSEAYNLQEDNAYNDKKSTSIELVFNAQYLSCM